MTLAFTNFAELPYGPLGDRGEWTDLNATEWSGDDSLSIESGGDYGGRILAGEGDFYKFWDGVDPVADVSVLARVRIIAHTTASTPDGIIIRASDSTKDGYAAGFIGSSNVRIRGWDDGAAFSVGSITSFSSSLNTWYWLRLEASGTTIQMKVWSGDFDTEPGSWTISATDSTVSAAGHVGIQLPLNGDCDFDYFAVGTPSDRPRLWDFDYPTPDTPDQPGLRRLLKPLI
ncbi:MAG: hypothetical protein ACLFRV_03955 [Acidimicrobiales bacterium]